jgi:hypothetical protein
VQNFEKIDFTWLGRQVSIIKGPDEGNRAGAIFELLGLNMFASAGNHVIPAAGSNPGYDGTVESPDQSSLIVSIKNHGLTSYEKFFQQNARQLDHQFRKWLKEHRQSGIELRIHCVRRLDTTAWVRLKQDVKNILDGQLDGTAKNYKTKGQWTIILNHISSEYSPLSQNNISSVSFIYAPTHQNEQVKFVEDIRRGCSSNLVRHTANFPDNACRVLFVRLGASASIRNFIEWSGDYFMDFPQEKVGLIILYQSVAVTSNGQTSLAHHVTPILGPQFATWANPVGSPERHLPHMSIFIGVIIQQAARKVIQSNGRQIALDDAYSYQRGDIYRSYRLTEGSGVQFHLSNPAPGIKVHAEIGDDRGSAVLQIISSDRGELLLLP